MRYSSALGSDARVKAREAALRRAQERSRERTQSGLRSKLGFPASAAPSPLQQWRDPLLASSSAKPAERTQRQAALSLIAATARSAEHALPPQGSSNFEAEAFPGSSFLAGVAWPTAPPVPPNGSSIFDQAVARPAEHGMPPSRSNLFAAAEHVPPYGSSLFAAARGIHGHETLPSAPGDAAPGNALLKPQADSLRIVQAIQEVMCPDARQDAEQEQRTNSVFQPRTAFPAQDVKKGAAVAPGQHAQDKKDDEKMALKVPRLKFDPPAHMSFARVSSSQMPLEIPLGITPRSAITTPRSAASSAYHASGIGEAVWGSSAQEPMSEAPDLSLQRRESASKSILLSRESSVFSSATAQTHQTALPPVVIHVRGAGLAAGILVHPILPK